MVRCLVFPEEKSCRAGVPTQSPAEGAPAAARSGAALTSYTAGFGSGTDPSFRMSLVAADGLADRSLCGPKGMGPARQSRYAEPDDLGAPGCCGLPISLRTDSAIGALPLPAGLAEPARSVTTALRKERCR